MYTADFASNVKVIEQENGLIAFGMVTGTIPTTANKFRAGCVLIKNDSSTAPGGMYYNTGSPAAPTWALVDSTGTGSIPQQFSYYITNESGTYKAYNGTTGDADYTSADLDTVITSVKTAIGSSTPALIEFGRGTFVTTTGISFARGNLKIKGQGQGVTTIQGAAGSALDSTFIFGIDPTQSSSGYALTANATAGDLTITLSSGNLISSGLTAGDYFILYSSKSIDSELTSRNQGELHRVISVNTGTGVITIGQTNNGTHVYQTMLTSDSARVAKLTFYQNVSVEGITFTDAASSRANTLLTGQVLFSFVDNLTIRDCNFTDLYNAGLQIRQCMNTKVSDSFFKNIKDVTPSANVFYGMVIRGACTNTSVSNCNFDNMRHGVTQGAGTTAYYAGTTRNMSVIGCTSISTYTSHFDVHQGAEEVSFVGNTMVGDDGSANGIQLRSPAAVTGNSIVGVLGKGVSLFGTASGSIISGNDIKGCTDGVFCDVMVNKLNIVGNSIRSGTRGLTLSRSTQTVTMTIASPCVVTTSSSHGFTAGTRIVFSTSGALPTGITAGTVYYIIATGLTTTTFQFSATENGSAVNTSGSQSGTHTLIAFGGNETNIINNQIFDNSSLGIDSNGQRNVKVSGNTFRNNSSPFTIGNTNSTAQSWMVTDNYSNGHTSSNYPTFAGTGHLIKGNKGFGNNTIRYVRPNHFAVGSSDATPIAGRAYCCLVEVMEDTEIDQIVWTNGTAVSGNLRVAIYGPVVTEDTMLGAAVIYDSGDIAQSGVSNFQAHTLSSTKLLAAGRYYIALMLDNTTARFVRQSNQAMADGWVQYYDRGGGYGAFTNPAPAMTATGANCPCISLRAKVS